MNKKWLIARVREETGQNAVLPVLSELLGVSIVTVSSRMNGKTQFTPDEIDKIRIWLNMTDEDVVKVFIRQGGRAWQK